jgi:hypothetical protein
MDRRSFVSGAFGGGTSLALSEVLGFSSARAGKSLEVCDGTGCLDSFRGEQAKTGSRRLMV